MPGAPSKLTANVVRSDAAYPSTRVSESMNPLLLGQQKTVCSDHCVANNLSAMIPKRLEKTPMEAWWVALTFYRNSHLLSLKLERETKRSWKVLSLQLLRFVLKYIGFIVDVLTFCRVSITACNYFKDQSVSAMIPMKPENLPPFVIVLYRFLGGQNLT